jgi:hypothetical protein
MTEVVGDGEFYRLDLNLHPNEASGLLTVENEALLETHGWEFGLWAVLDEGRIEDCVAVIGHKRSADMSEGWEIERLHAAPVDESVKTEDAESVARHGGWVYMLGSHFGGKTTDPGRTLTGVEQERWLLDGLAASEARWNILVKQVFFAQIDFQGGDERQFQMDAWDGYPGCRDRIVDFVARRGVENPVVITGNVHRNWYNELLSDFDDPDSPSVGTEFVGTSITSGGEGSDVHADTAAILAENPHIKFFNGQRGYVRCRLTQDAWQADYRVLPYVKEPGASIVTRASLVVEDGNPRIQTASEEP